MNHDPSLRFALIASCILLALGYILAHMHSEDAIQIRVLPLKPSPGAETIESPPPNGVELKSLSFQRASPVKACHYLFNDVTQKRE